MKPLKRSVALVLEGPGGVLLVRRPDNDESLPGVWGLPAATLAQAESEEHAVRRAGRDKLGIEVRPLERIAVDEADRPAYRIAMSDWAVELLGGEPAVPQAGAGTQYDELRWGPAEELLPAARAGSLCARALLRSRGLGSWG